MCFNELRGTLQLRLSGEFKRFADEDLRAVLTLLAGPGVVWELAFGSLEASLPGRAEHRWFEGLGASGADILCRSYRAVGCCGRLTQGVARRLALPWAITSRPVGAGVAELACGALRGHCGFRRRFSGFGHEQSLEDYPTRLSRGGLAWATTFRPVGAGGAGSFYGVWLGNRWFRGRWGRFGHESPAFQLRNRVSCLLNRDFGLWLRGIRLLNRETKVRLRDDGRWWSAAWSAREGER